MSIKVMSHVWDHSMAKGSELLLLLAIADHAHDNGSNAFPSIESLAHKTRLSRRQTQYNIRNLVQLGELEVHENAGPKGVHLYRVVMGEGCSPLHRADIAPVQDATPGGATHGTEGVQPIAHKPSLTVKESSLSPLEKEFEDFWDIYPRKEGKQDALKAWKQYAPSQSLQLMMHRAVVEQTTNNWSGREKKHIPMPATWVRGHRWEDEISTAGPQQPAPPGVTPLPGEVWRQEGDLWKSECPNGRRRGWHPGYYGVLWDSDTYRVSGREQFYADVEEAKKKAGAS